MRTRGKSIRSRLHLKAGDITGRKRMEQQLQLAGRLAGADELVAGVITKKKKERLGP